MDADTIECWLCEVALPRDVALVRYRDEQWRVHPWPDRRGRWQPEYICPACALVYADRTVPALRAGGCSTTCGSIQMPQPGGSTIVSYTLRLLIIRRTPDVRRLGV